MSTEAHPVLIALRKAARGLLLMSEADHPLRPFLWSADDLGGQGVTEEGVRRMRCVPRDAPVRELTLEQLLGPSAQRQDWHGESEFRTADRFADLIAAVNDSLRDVRVFAFGDVARDVVVIGRTADGCYAGLTTRLVET